MVTPSTPDPAFENVRRRARRLRLAVAPQRRFDRFAIGVLSALLVDLIGVTILVVGYDWPLLYVFLIGPLSLAMVMAVWFASISVLVAACLTRRLRLAWGVFATQAGLALLACIWPLVIGGGRLLPL